jgi:hypothetical protein
VTKPKSRSPGFVTRFLAILIASAVARHFYGTDTATVTPTVDPPKQEQLVPAGQPGANAWVLRSCTTKGKLYYNGPARSDEATCVKDLEGDREELADINQAMPGVLDPDPGVKCPADACIKVTLNDQGRLPKLAE